MRTAIMMVDPKLGTPLLDEQNHNLVLFSEEKIFLDNGEILHVAKDIVEAMGSSRNITVDTDDGPIQLIFDETRELEKEVPDNDRDSSRDCIDNEEENDIQLSAYWDEKSTKLLLSLYEEFRPLVGKTIRFKTQNKMWLEIAREMEKKGYKFTPLQVNNRFKTLERSYKKMVDNNNKTGRNNKKIPYERELEAILGTHERISPPAVIGREGLKILKKPKTDDNNEYSLDSDKQDEDIEHLEMENPPQKKLSNKPLKEKENKEKPLEKSARARKIKDVKMQALVDIGTSMKENSENLKKILEERFKTNDYLKEANILRRERNDLLKELITKQAK